MVSFALPVMDETVTFKSANDALIAPINTYTQIPIQASENAVWHHFGRVPGEIGGLVMEGCARLEGVPGCAPLCKDPHGHFSLQNGRTGKPQN